MVSGLRKVRPGILDSYNVTSRPACTADILDNCRYVILMDTAFERQALAPGYTTYIVASDCNLRILMLAARDAYGVRVHLMDLQEHTTSFCSVSLSRF